MPCTACCSIGATVKPGKVPTTMHATTNNSMGKRIQRGGSCGVLGKFSGVGPKNTSVINRKEYTTLKVLATMAASGSQVLREPKPAASAKNISFDKKPFNKGTPAMAAAATMANVAVTGI